MGSHFQFHGYETKKKVTNSDCQNHTTIESFLKTSLRFQSYPTTEYFDFFSETGAKNNETAVNVYFWNTPHYSDEKIIW